MVVVAGHRLDPVRPDADDRLGEVLVGEPDRLEHAPRAGPVRTVGQGRRVALGRVGRAVVRDGTDRASGGVSVAVRRAGGRGDRAKCRTRPADRGGADGLPRGGPPLCCPDGSRPRPHVGEGDGDAHRPEARTAQADAAAEGLGRKELEEVGDAGRRDRPAGGQGPDARGRHRSRVLRPRRRLGRASIAAASGSRRCAAATSSARSRCWPRARGPRPPRPSSPRRSSSSAIASSTR